VHWSLVLDIISWLIGGARRVGEVASWTTFRLTTVYIQLLLTPDKDNFSMEPRVSKRDRKLHLTYDFATKL
jgi:hypothetical protein